MNDITPSAPRGPLDLEHLDRQTLGDVDLRDEILKMFLAQSEVNLAALRKVVETPDIGHSNDWLVAAHSLKGTSRSIGAFALADIAEILEPYGRDAIHECGQAGLEKLDGELRHVHATIADLLTVSAN